jgi:succinate-semialdehyde dehydrogenase/glutarate-semialdehyde dehydrogenase
MAHAKAGPRGGYATVNPYTNEVVREFPSLRGEEIDRVMERAHRASGPWGESAAEERAAIVGRAALLMRKRYEELARTITQPAPGSAEARTRVSGPSGPG